MAALDYVRSQGAKVSLAGPDRLRVRIPAGRRDLVDFMREHKQAIIAELRTEALRRGEYDLPEARPDEAGILRAWLESGALARVPVPLRIGPGVTVTDAERAARSLLLGMATGGVVRDADRANAANFIEAVRRVLPGRAA